MTAAPTEIASQPPSSWPIGSDKSSRSSNNSGNAAFSNRAPQSKEPSRVSGRLLRSVAAFSRDTVQSENCRVSDSSTIMPAWDTLMAQAEIDCDEEEQSRADEGNDMKSPASSKPSRSGHSQDEDEEGVEEISPHDLHYKDSSLDTVNSSRGYSEAALRKAFELGWQYGSAEVLDSAFRNSRHSWQTKSMGDSGGGAGRMMVPYQSVARSAAPSLTEQFTSAFGVQGVNLAASAVLTGLLTAGKWGVCAGLRALRS